MTVAVSVSLVGASVPRQVQVEVTGLVVDDIVTIQGTVGSWSWTVRGANGISAESTQLIRRDNLAPVNAEFTYTVTVNGTDYESDPITVPYSGGNYVLTALGGGLAATVLWAGNGAPTSFSDSSHLSYVPGRETPVVRWSAGGGEAGTWRLVTESNDATAVLRAMVKSGAPLVMRTNGSLMDFPPARVFIIRGASSALLGTSRDWSVPWVEVSDPLASTPVASWTFEDFNAVATALGGTFADVNAFITSIGGTFAAVNRFDWESEAAS